MQPVLTDAAAQSPSALSVRIAKALAAVPRAFTLEAELSVAPGITILFGASGAGKTTLLDCIAGLTRPDSGRIVAAEQVFFDSSARINLPAQRRKVGYVFQDLALFPHLSVEKNVEYGLHPHSASAKRNRAEAILESFRIADLRMRKPGEISGGERQRVALARALVTDPCVLLLDEPLAGLDAPTKAKILDDLRQWNQSKRIPVIYVTHNREEVFALGERVAVIDDGRLIAQGTPHEVMTAPRQETVAQLAGFENVFDAAVSAIHEDRGTMTCEIVTGQIEVRHVALETPLARADVGSKLRVGIRAGDILLASIRPVGLSAQNVIPAKVASVVQRDFMTVAYADCGVRFEIHLTLAARNALHLQAGSEVWLIVKTYSCHLLRS